MEELRPCPQCGAEGTIEKLYTILNSDIVPFKWAVICNKCRFMSKLKGTKTAAIKAWNGRTE